MDRSTFLQVLQAFATDAVKSDDPDVRMGATIVSALFSALVVNPDDLLTVFKGLLEDIPVPD